MTTTTQTTSAARAAGRPNYRIYDRTGGGCTHDIFAASLDNAIEQGREWIEDGERSSEDGMYRTITLDCCVREIVRIPDLSSIEALPAVYGVEIVDDVIHALICPEQKDALATMIPARLARVEPADTAEPAEMRVAVCLAGPVPMMIDEAATADGQSWDCSGTYSDTLPDCEATDAPADDTDEQGHDWRTPYSLVGGCKENPGVHSLGGTAMTQESVCRLCGKYRTERTSGSQRNPDKALSVVTIRDRDEASEAWLKSEHEEDGVLPEWLAELLGCEREITTQ